MSPKPESAAPPTGGDADNDAGRDGRIGRLILNLPNAEPARWWQYDRDGDRGLVGLRVLPLPGESEDTGESWE